MKVFKYFFTLCILFSALFTFGQKTISIEDIINNPGRVLEESIQTEGIVTQFVPESSTTNAHYLLKGKYGGIIMVKTDNSEPVQNKQYKVIGTVYSDNGRPFIHEKTKSCIDCDPEPVKNGSSQEDVNKTRQDNTLLYVIIGSAALLIVVLVFFFTQNKKNTTTVTSSTGQTTNNQNTNPTPSSIPSQQTFVSEDDDFKTIKLSTVDNDPKTMKFIPGKLELISGDDKGKTFRIAGYPTSEGSVVTIGRQSIKGDRAYAHIHIDAKFRTVSREQAELIYRDGKLFVKNMSDANPTQVDGKEISGNKLVELKSESIMRTGELEFKYKV